MGKKFSTESLTNLAKFLLKFCQKFHMKKRKKQQWSLHPTWGRIMLKLAMCLKQGSNHQLGNGSSGQLEEQ
jgi:hypothetical protein